MSRLFNLATLHFIANICIKLKDTDADTASMTAHALEYYFRLHETMDPEDTSYTAGCFYHIDVVKDAADGMWKIKKWEIKDLWITSDTCGSARMKSLSLHALLTFDVSCWSAQQDFCVEPWLCTLLQFSANTCSKEKSKNREVYDLVRNDFASRTLHSARNVILHEEEELSNPVQPSRKNQRW